MYITLSRRLTQHFGLNPSDYTAVRCGMNVSKAIKKGEIDAGMWHCSGMHACSIHAQR